MKNICPTPVSVWRRMTLTELVSRENQIKKKKNNIYAFNKKREVP